MSRPTQFDLSKIDERAEVTRALVGKLNNGADDAGQVPDALATAALIDAIYELEAMFIGLAGVIAGK